VVIWCLLLALSVPIIGSSIPLMCRLYGILIPFAVRPVKIP